MRSLYQNLAIATCVLMLLAVADGCWQALRQDKTLFRVASGHTALASGDLVIPSDREGVRLHAEVSAGGRDLLARHVAAVLDAPDISVRFLELKGRLWRAQITAEPGARPGTFPMRVVFGGQPLDEAPAYVVRVYPSPAALRADLPSLLERQFGVQPWWIVLGCIPLALAFGMAVFRMAGRDLELLRRSGIGPIYKLAKRKQGWEVVFGLGSESGVRDGDRLLILNREYRPVGHLVAESVSVETGQAVVPLDADIGPGHFVALER